MYILQGGKEGLSKNKHTDGTKLSASMGSSSNTVFHLKYFMPQFRQDIWKMLATPTRDQKNIRQAAVERDDLNVRSRDEW